MESLPILLDLVIRGLQISAGLVLAYGAYVVFGPARNMSKLR